MSENHPLNKASDQGVNARLATVQCLQAVLDQGRSLTEVLEYHGEHMTDAREFRLVSALSYGVLRWYDRLHAICNQLLKTPLRMRERDIQLLLLIAMFQLMEERTPAYAVVASSVDTAARLGKVWAKALVNGVLRNFIRKQQKLIADLEVNPSAYYAFPVWLYDMIKADWPEYATSIFTASNIQAPMTLRINTQKNSVEHYLQMLADQNIPAVRLPAPETAVCMEVPCDVSVLPGFDEGCVSVQDAAAQYAAILLESKPNERVLDACSAPGGKTTHILERTPGIAHLLAVDIDAERLDRVWQNLQRLIPNWEKRVILKTADLTGNREAWWDGNPFDKILLDVPCSATGIIRRHPDIKHLRKASDIKSLCERQQHILENVWPTLALGGLLLYVSCSILKCENELQIETFLAKHADAALMPLKILEAQARPAGYQILPQAKGMLDGFFYAALIKRIKR